MNKITLLLLVAILSISFKSNAQCSGTDLPVNLYTGEYFIYDITPDVLEYSSFNLAGAPTPVTLFSEDTDVSQTKPFIPIPLNYRSFDAVYLPDVGVGQDPETFAIQFNPGTCEVTFNAVTGIDNSSGLQCTSPLILNPASGGSYNDADDTEFTIVFLTNIDNDCGDTAKNVELFFSTEFLNTEEFVSEGFSHYTSWENILNVRSNSDPIQNIVIYNLSGQKLMDGQFNTPEVALDVASLSTGVYLAKVETARIEGTFKFIVR